MQMTAGDGDVLLEAQEATVTITAFATTRKVGVALSMITVSAQAFGFATTTDQEGTASAIASFMANAAGVQLGEASSSVSISCSATTFKVATATASVITSLSANPTILGPRSAQADVLVRTTVSAVGTRVHGMKTPPRPVGRTIDWKSLVEGAAAKVPDYEFGHKPTKRRFYQR